MDVKLVSFLDLPFTVQMNTLNWRNNYEITKFFKIKYISPETHRAWLQSLTLDYPSNMAWIIQYNKEFVGVTYFHSINYKNLFCDFGIYIYNTIYQSKGIGKIVLREMINIATNKLYMKTIYLDVSKTNIKAIMLYESMGFKLISSNDTSNNFLRYVLEIKTAN